MFAFLAFPAVLQLCVLPFLPESPRYLLMERRDEDGARRGTALLSHYARRKCTSSGNDYVGTRTFRVERFPGWEMSY